MYVILYVIIITYQGIIMARNVTKTKILYKNLGPTGAILIQSLSRTKTPVFTTYDALQILKIDPKSLNKILHDLVQKGWLKRIEKGKYILVPIDVEFAEAYTENQFIIASKLIKPYYLGFWSMLHFYGFTEQLINTIFIGSTRRKKKLHLWQINYKFVKVKPERMYGITEIKINDTGISVSDKEKTLVDCLGHPEYCGGIQEVTKSIWNARSEINFSKLIDYGSRYGNSAIFKRLGYLLELLGLNGEIPMNDLRVEIKNGFSALDPLLPKKGKYNRKWNLLVNIPEEELLSFKAR